MNERIRELWDKAAESTAAYPSGQNNSWETQVNFMNTFAELIVKECANVLRAESERLYKLSAEEKDELFASNFEICAEKCVDNEVAIKEHFGVEE